MYKFVTFSGKGKRRGRQKRKSLIRKPNAGRPDGNNPVLDQICQGRKKNGFLTGSASFLNDISRISNREMRKNCANYCNSSSRSHMLKKKLNMKVDFKLLLNYWLYSNKFPCNVYYDILTCDFMAIFLFSINLYKIDCDLLSVQKLLNIMLNILHMIWKGCSRATNYYANCIKLKNKHHNIEIYISEFDQNVWTSSQHDRLDIAWTWLIQDLIEMPKLIPNWCVRQFLTSDLKVE